MTGEARGGRQRLRRAVLAAIVVGATTVGLAPGPVDAASDTCAAAPCVEVRVRGAGTVSAPVYLTAADLGTATGGTYTVTGSDGQTQQRQLRGVTLSGIASAVGASGVQQVGVLRTDRSADAIGLQESNQPQQDLLPIVFSDGGALGFVRPGAAGTSTLVDAGAGQNLSIDLYTSGKPLTDVAVKAPKNVKVGQAATFTATPTGGSSYVWSVRGRSTGASLTTTFGQSRDRTVNVAVTLPDGSYGASPDVSFTIGPPDKPSPTPTPTRGTGGNGNGSGTTDRGSSDGRQGGTGTTGSTGTGSGLGSGFGSNGAPIDPFRVPPSADGLFSTELPSFGSASGPQQVAGLVLTGSDGRGQLADLGSDSDDEVATPPPTLGRASPLAIALLVAGILLVLLASAASELTGLSLSPPTRPRRNPRDR